MEKILLIFLSFMALTCVSNKSREENIDGERIDTLKLAPVTFDLSVINQLVDSLKQGPWLMEIPGDNLTAIVYYNRDVKDGYFISYKCVEDSLYSTKHIGLYKKDIPSGRWFFFYDDTPMKGVAFTLSEISENLDFPNQAFEMQAFMQRYDAWLNRSGSGWVVFNLNDFLTENFTKVGEWSPT